MGTHLEERVIKPNGCLALPQLQGGALFSTGSGPFPEGVHMQSVVDLLGLVACLREAQINKPGGSPVTGKGHRGQDPTTNIKLPLL